MTTVLQPPHPRDILYAAKKDTSYLATGPGPSVADYLAWKRLQGAAERTLDSYERELVRICEAFPDKTIAQLVSEDMLYILAPITNPATRRKVRAIFNDYFRDYPEHAG